METSTFEQRIEKLRKSKAIISSGKEYVGLYDLNNRSAEKFIRTNLRGNYGNIDTGDIIRITRKGAEKVTRHDAESLAHLKSLAIIPELIGVKNGTTYYDHALTQIGKEKLLRSIDEIKRPFASKESSDNGELASDVLSECNDDANESRAKLV